MPQKSVDAVPAAPPAAGVETGAMQAPQDMPPLPTLAAVTVATQILAATANLPTGKRPEAPASPAKSPTATAANSSSPVQALLPALDLVSHLVLATQVAPVHVLGQAAALKIQQTADSQADVAGEAAAGADAPTVAADGAAPASLASTPDASAFAAAVATAILLPTPRTTAVPASGGRQSGGVQADIGSPALSPRLASAGLPEADSNTAASAIDAASLSATPGDRVPAWTTASLGANAGDAVGLDGPATPTALAPLALPAQAADTPSAWQQPLLQALGQRLTTQLLTHGEQAVLHLAPPQLGRIDIAIRQQGGVLQVQMSATHEEVVTQLRQISEPLRHELVQRHAGDVTVQVAAGGLSGSDAGGRDASRQGAPGQDRANEQGQRSRDERSPARARDESETAASADEARTTGFAERLRRTANASIG